MRRFLTIGITGTGKVDILHGADKQKRDHVDEFNQLAKAGKGKKAKKSKYAEVQVIDLSRGVVKRKRYSALDGDAKRTIARTVKKRAKKAASKKAKKSAAKKTKKAATKAPKRNARKTSSPKPPVAPPANNGSGAANEGSAPALPGARPTA